MDYNICGLPPEMILHIIGYLPIHDRLSLALTNKEMYQIVWEKIDTHDMFDKLFCFVHLNYYCSLLLIKNWVSFPFLILLPSSKIIFVAFAVQENKFRIRINNCSCMDDWKIFDLLLLRKLGFAICNTIFPKNNLIYEKPIHTFEDKRLQIEMLHYNIILILRTFDFISYNHPEFDEYIETPIWKDIVVETLENLGNPTKKELYLEKAKKFNEEYLGFDDYFIIKEISNTMKCLDEYRILNQEMHSYFFDELHSCIKKLDKEAIRKLSIYLNKLLNHKLE